MGDKTAIEWVDATWEPVSGCTPVSEGCQRCYAKRLAEGRLRRFYPDGFGAARCHPERLEQPLHWRKPRRVFVCSRADLFHEDVAFESIRRIWNAMALSECHTFLILTKRPERMQAFLDDVKTKKWATALKAIWESSDMCWRWPLPNVWLGVSVENQARAEERIPLLLQTPAAVRFVSVEPMLAPVDLSRWLPTGGSTPRLDWVVAGCESGPGARPADPDWFRDLRAECRRAGTAYFLKQMRVDGKLVHMPELDGRVWAEIPA